MTVLLYPRIRYTIEGNIVDKQYNEVWSHHIIVERSPINHQAVTVSKDLYDDLAVGDYAEVHFYDNYLGCCWSSVNIGLDN